MPSIPAQRMMTKKDIRDEVRRRLADAPQSRELPESTLSMIFSSAQWLSARRILLYSALGDEASADGLISRAWEEGKEVCLPAVEGATIRIFPHKPGGELRKGRFGIAEPFGEDIEIKDLDSIDLAFIPGRAFTPDGRRTGRGGGYYDRLLPALKCPKWGLALKAQIFDSLPTDPWDVRMDRVWY